MRSLRASDSTACLMARRFAASVRVMALLMYGLVVRIVERAKDSTRERLAAHRMPSFRIRYARDPLGNARKQPQAPTRIGSWAGTAAHPLLSARQLSNKSIRKLRASSTLGAPREVLPSNPIPPNHPPVLSRCLQPRVACTLVDPRALPAESLTYTAETCAPSRKSLARRSRGGFAFSSCCSLCIRLHAAGL
jgi:hypothetical protein